MPPPLTRGTSARHHRELWEALRRLRATLVITDIRFEDQPDEGMETGFNWLSGYWVPKRYSRGGVMTPESPDGEPDPSRPWEIELPPWLYKVQLAKTGENPR